MKQYLELLNDVLTNGKQKGDRTGTGTLSVFGRQLRFNLNEGFPLVTTKKIHWKSVVHELLWMISGSTNVKDLQKHGVTIWNEWADKDGELGPVYGSQWRKWYGIDRDFFINTDNFQDEQLRDGLFYKDFEIDQLDNAINLLKEDPDSRRILVSAWNVLDIDNMKLPPCHFCYQFYSSKEDNGRRYLSCHMNMRSVDTFLGLPFNIASYALLTHLVAKVTNHEVDKLIISLGDTHIYNNHIDQVKLQLSRKPLHLPEVILNPSISDIDKFTFEDIELIDYKYHPHIKAKVSV